MYACVSFTRSPTPESHPRVVLAVGMAADEELNVDTLCQEYVSGQSVSEAPKMMAKGSLQSSWRPKVELI